MARFLTSVPGSRKCAPDFSHRKKRAADYREPYVAADIKACLLYTSRIAQDRKEMKRKTENAIRFVMVICIPCAVGLSVLATPILTLLFGAKDHLQLSALLLQTGSLSVVLYGMSTPVSYTHLPAVY